MNRLIRFAALFACMFSVPVLAQENDIVDTAVNAGSFNTLVTAVQAAGLEDALRGDGPFTVFAPTDEAFANLPEGTLDALLADTEALTNVLLYHVVAGQVLAADVVNLSEAETLQGSTVSIMADENGVKINEANVLTTDVLATNGVIHVIDQVLIPPPDALNLIETAEAAGQFNTLIAAVDAAGLRDALTGENDLTVFAPTDEAFANLPEGTLDALLADPNTLTEILLYHALLGSILSGDVVAADELLTLQGEAIDVTVMGDMVKLNDANLLAADIEASNGVIHVIDTVLIPPSLIPSDLPDIVDTAIAAGSFNTLVTAVQAAGLEEALRGEGPFTVFAPTDEAFAKLPEDTLNFLLDNPETLAEILLFHVVSGNLGSGDVLAAPSLQTLQGSFAIIDVNDSGAFIENAEIIATDVEAGNGTIHVIDTVILPPNLNGTTYEVSITNLTKGQIFSPPVVVSHRENIELFEAGTAASDGLKQLAEDGITNALIGEIGNSDSVYDIQQAAGAIPPGETVTVTITTRSLFNKISVAGMLVVTNDAFFAAELEAPRALADLVKRRLDVPAESRAFAIAYDAGTEYNSESCADIPGPPCGNPGVSPAEAGEGYIYISNGIHGVGDLATSDYDWRGPVALIKVTRR